jgi:hypothetical protein
MDLFYSILITGYLCFSVVWIAYLQTRLNITQSKLEDLEFLYDLRK